MKLEKFRITLGYLNGDMHVPNNKNIIFLRDGRKRKFKTSYNNCWKFSNRIDTMDLRLFPRKVYHMLITINMKSDIAFVAINNSPCSIQPQYLLWFLKCWLPPLCPQCQIFLNIPEKIIFQFQGIWRTFIFGVFFYCKDNSENR